MLLIVAAMLAWFVSTAHARWYDPGGGRFLEADPLEYADGMNRFEFVGSNPLRWTDPFGTTRDGRPADVIEAQRTDLAAQKVIQQYIIDKIKCSGLSGEARDAAIAGAILQINAIGTRVASGADYDRYRLLQSQDTLSVNYTGYKAVANAFVEAPASFVSLGHWQPKVYEVNEYDLANNYGAANAAARVSSELTFGMVAGYAGTISHAGKVIAVADALGNGYMAGQGAYSIHQNGWNWGSATQVIAGAAGVGGNVGGASCRSGNISGVSAPRSAQSAAVPRGDTYSVAVQTRLNSSSYPGVSRARHFQEANESLLRTMETDSHVAQAMRRMGINLQRTPTGLAPRQAPAGWTWHHAQEPGVLQLVPRPQHTAGSIFWNTLHPGGQGGYAVWGR
jgi:hypothetical protein